MIVDELKRYMLEYGFNNEDINKILAVYTFKENEILFFNIKKINTLLETLGYTQNDIVKMAKRFPLLYSYSMKNIKQKIKDMQKLGYSYNDVIKIIKQLPAIYGYSIEENIKQKIKDMLELGYSYNDIIKMTKQLPSIYSYSIENIKQKIELYRLMNISHILVEKATYLMQSCELSFSRYMFYKNKGIIIDENNYPKLFIDQLKFKRLYGIDNKTLIQMYNYDEYFSKEKNVLIKI